MEVIISMKDQLKNILEEAKAQLSNAVSTGEAEEVRVNILGK